MIKTRENESSYSKMAACPNDSYLKKVQTASGLVPKHSYNLQPNEFALGEWGRLNLALLFDVHASLKALASSKSVTAWTADETERWEEFQQEVLNLDERYSVMPSPNEIFTSGVTAQQIDVSVRFATDAVCLQQRLDEETQKLGGRPHGQSSVAPAKMGFLAQTLLVTSLVGGGALLLYGAHSLQKRNEEKGST
jgi:hypothetical protein